MLWGAQGIAHSTIVVVGWLPWSRSVEMVWYLTRYDRLSTYYGRPGSGTAATPDFGEWLQNFRKPMGKSWGRLSTAIIRSSPPQL